MSDREPGVFYILHLNEIKDTDPWGWHLELCVEYYRDYGETLVGIYCHDVTKDYNIETCEAVTDLSSEKMNINSILLSWSEPEEVFEIEGYAIFRNSLLLSEELITNNLYLDENLLNGNYEYYVVTHYTNGCVSDTSNHVEETIELGVKGVKELEGVILFPNPTTGELRIENGELRIENVEIFDVYGRKESFGYAQLPKAEGRKEKGEGSMVLDISELRSGIYFLKITTETGIIMKKVIKY